MFLIIFLFTSNNRSIILYVCTRQSPAISSYTMRTCSTGFVIFLNKKCTDNIYRESIMFPEKNNKVYESYIYAYCIIT